MLRKLFQMQEITALGATILLTLYFFATVGEPWFNNMPGLLRDVSWLGIVAIGAAVVMISGEFDLSVGSVYAFVSMMFLVLLQHGFGPALAFVLAMGLATAIGLLNGWLVWRFQVPSLLVTLGALFFYRGLVEYVTDGQTIIMPSEIQEGWLIQLLGGKTFGLHNSIYICALVLLAFTIVLARTRFGNHLYAVGGDVNAATATGVPCGAVKIRGFVISSTLAGLAGIITACNLNSVSTTTAGAMEFEAIAAAVIGGVSLMGGLGSAWGAVLGVVTLLSLKNGLILGGVNIFTYQILLGVVLVGIVAFKGILPGQHAQR